MAATSASERQHISLPTTEQADRATHRCSHQTARAMITTAGLLTAPGLSPRCDSGGVGPPMPRPSPGFPGEKGACNLWSCAGSCSQLRRDCHVCSTVAASPRWSRSPLNTPSSPQPCCQPNAVAIASVCPPAVHALFLGHCGGLAISANHITMCRWASKRGPS